MTEITPVQQALSGLIFISIVGITVFGALVATNAKQLIRAVSGLAICSFGLAGLYYFLNSPFVALMEILIYIGAVCVTIAFGIMLANPRQEETLRARLGVGGAAAFGAAFALFWGLSRIARSGGWATDMCRVNDGSVAEIGKALLTTYSMVFELISLVLLVSILGALVVARSGRGTSQN